MTFRLVNMGHREIWHQTEFMYHTWHPGQAGEDNYLGPHDGRHVSTTALDALLSGRIMPLEENESIRHHRSAELAKPGIGEFMIDRAHFIAWQRSQLRKDQKWVPGSSSRKIWFGFVVDQTTTGLVAHPRFLEHPEFSTMQCKLQVHARTEADLNGQLNKLIPLRLRMIFPLVTFSTYLSKAIGLVAVYLQRRLSRLANQG
jgi:hypothetical protein